MYELTDEALTILGNLFVENLKKKIQSKIYPYGNPQKGVGNKMASGNLYKSIKSKVIIGKNNEPTLEITYADYFKYVNKGRKPQVKRVPLNALLEWIKIRGIQGRDKKGKFIKRLSLAFAMQQNIYKYGIRPANIYDKALDSLEDIFDNPPSFLKEALADIYEAIEQDINNFIEKTIEVEVKL